MCFFAKPMITYAPMQPEDLLSLDTTNLDAKTENFTFDYYMGYFLLSPLDFFAIKCWGCAVPLHTCMIYTNRIVGYVFGKKQHKEKLCYHLSALSIAPPYRNMGLGTVIMGLFEATGNYYAAWFSDLFVRASNTTAISLYRKLGYCMYRVISSYYGCPVEDALDMRKSLNADTTKLMMEPGEDIHCRDYVEY